MSRPEIPDEAWYLRKSYTTRGQSSFCPIATCEGCPRYYLSLKLLDSVLTGMLQIASSKKTEIEAKWQASDAFIIEDSAPEVLYKTSKLDGVSNFCPEVTAKIFGMYCAELRPYADEDHRDNVNVNAWCNGELNGLARDWAIFEPCHYSECREFSIYGAGIRKRNKARGSVSNNLRWMVFERDNFTCVYCGSRGGNGVVLHVDHKISRANGGIDTIENLVTACEKCNNGKGARNVVP